MEKRKDREIGCYWCYGVSWHDKKNWAIYWWDGNYFWNGNEDYGSEALEKIDEKQVIRVAHMNTILKRAIYFIETNTIEGQKSKKVATEIVTDLTTLLW